MTPSGRSRKYQERAPVEATGLPGRYLVAGCLRKTARDSGLEAAWTMCVVIVCTVDRHYTDTIGHPLLRDVVFEVAGGGEAAADRAGTGGVPDLG
jgi:hypothetical protein